jgi:hypothetical protein
LTDKLENYNEKFTFAMQSFQSTLGSLGTRMSEQREMVGFFPCATSSNTHTHYINYYAHQQKIALFNDHLFKK